MTEHPITPPPELVEQWRTAPEYISGREKLMVVTMTERRLHEIAVQATRYGADQELKACLEEIRDGVGRAYIDGSKLRVCLADDIWTARRPNPPSLKKQALAELDILKGDANAHGLGFDAPAIRRALEALPDEP